MYSRRIIRGESWKYYMGQKNGHHAFGYNSAEREPIWMKFGTLWARCYSSQVLSYHSHPTLCPLAQDHWMHRIRAPLTYLQSPYNYPTYTFITLHNLISVERLALLFIRRYCCSATFIILSKNNWSILNSFRYASPCLWDQLPLSLRQPHSGTSYSISNSPIPSPITSFSSDSCTTLHIHNSLSLSLPA